MAGAAGGVVIDWEVRCNWRVIQAACGTDGLPAASALGTIRTRAA